MPGIFEKEFEVESINKLQEVLPLLQSYAASFDNEFDGLTEKELEETTYICPVCGKRNNISDLKCRRCGRDKARSEELALKQRIPSFEDAVEIPDTPHIMPVRSSVPVQTERKPEFVNGKRSADSTYAGASNNGGFAGGGYAGGGYAAGGFMQGAPIVQPLAIVPYLSQEQPLWQYSSRADYENYKRAKGYSAPANNKK